MYCLEKTESGGKGAQDGFGKAVGRPSISASRMPPKDTALYSEFEFVEVFSINKYMATKALVLYKQTEINMLSK